MRIRSIAVESVLHYGGFHVDFGQGPGGLSILHGPNEAGKSTLLHILIDMLYGTTADSAFKAAYTSQSRVEAQLEHQGGAVLRIGRRKQRNRWVLDEESVITEEQLLRDYLGGYGRDRFSLLFGFDHQTLRDGGESLLHAGGHAGISLFEAGAGIQHLQNLFATLTDRSTNLIDPSFRKNAKATLNQVMRAYQEKESAKRQQSLRGEDWQKAQASIEQKKSSLASLKSALRSQREEQRRIERVMRVQSPLATLSQMRQELLGLDDHVVLPDWVDERIPELHKEISDFRQRLSRERADLGRYEIQRSEIAVDPEVLVESDVIAELSEGLQQFETYRVQDLPDLEERIQQASLGAERLCSTLAPGVNFQEVERWAIPFSDLTDIRRILKDLPLSKKTLDEATLRADEMDVRLAALHRQLEELGELPNIKQLLALLKEVRGRGDYPTRFKELEADLEKREAKLNALLHGQTVVDVSLADLGSLSIPLRSTLLRYQQHFALFEEKAKDTEREHTTIQQALDASRKELQQLERYDRPPIAADLDAARRYRTQGWQLVKAAWLNKVESSIEMEEFREGRPLAEAFEASLQAADAMADRMWQNATAVAHRQRLIDDVADLEARLQTCQGQQDALRNEHRVLWQSWSEAWTGSNLVPKTPAEMIEFVDRVYEPLVAGFDGLLDVQQRLSEIREQHSDDVKRLARAGFASIDHDLSAQLSQAEHYVEQVNARTSQQISLQGEIRSLEQTRAETDAGRQRAESEVGRGLSEWTSFRTRYPALPEREDTALAYLDQLDQLFSMLDQMKRLQIQKTRLNHTMEKFQSAVLETCRRLHEPLNDSAESIAVTVRKLRGRWETANAAQQQYLTIEGEIQALQDRQEELGIALSTLEGELQRYLTDYSCSSLDALRERSQASLTYKKALKACRQAEAAVLQAAGAGISLEAVEAEMQMFDGVDLEVLATEIQGAVDRGESEVSEAERALTVQQEAFRRLTSEDSSASDYAQEQEACLNQIDRLWNEYLRVELARRLLDRSIESFRRQNESAILTRAGAFFALLTLKRYQGIAVEYEQDQPFIKAVSHSERSRGVQELSDGTRDQLFLSLRLAFLEQHTRVSEPLPLILDDILVHFDDDRSRATLELLSELAERTQILYFTHHQAVVDAALKLKDSGRVSIRTMAPSVLR